MLAREDNLRKIVDTVNIDTFGTYHNYAIRGRARDQRTAGREVHD
jgi:hypothetical protein